MSDYVVVTSTSNTVTVINQPSTIVVGDSAMRGPIGPAGPTGATGNTGAQGPTGNTGLKGLYWEGAWTEQLNYSVTQAVFYEGNSYICIANNANTIPIGNTSTWDLLAQKGNDGSNGANGVIWSTVPASNTASGVAGDIAYDANGNLYICFATNAWSKISGNTIW